MPKVSIAIPAFKTAYLRRAIQSAIDQTYRDLEIIVVNDHSPESIEEVVRSFDDERLRYYANGINLGASCIVHNWNRCLSYAKGEYFCLLCDDDYYEPEFVEEMLNLAKRYPECDVLRARAKIIDWEGNITDYYPSSPDFETVYDYMYHMTRGWRRQTISEFMFRTEPFAGMGGYVALPAGICSDNASVYQLGKKHGIASTPKVLVAFRDWGNSISCSTGRVVEKISAENQFTAFVYNMLDESDCDSLLADLIRRWRVWQESRMIRHYLTMCDFSELMRLFRHGPTHLHIEKKDLLMAIPLRIDYGLRQLVRRIRHNAMK